MSTNNVTVSCQIPREIYERFLKQYPKYGELSSKMRSLFKLFVEGKIQLK